MSKSDGKWVEKRGGKRAGSGRKKADNSINTYSVRITPEQVELLKLWGGGDISAGLRWLMSVAAIFVQQREQTTDQTTPQ